MNDNTNKTDIDFDSNCQSLKISMDIYMRILIKAVEQTESDLSRLDEALKQNDLISIAEISHRIKGDYSNMRIEQLSLAAREMELTAKGEGDKDKLAACLDRIKFIFSDTNDALNNRARTSN